MAIRNDITIDWSLSPRIIEVSKDGASPTSLTVQDLYDTVRSLADDPAAIDDDEIIDAGGRETLSVSETVVLTVTLYNAKIKFEERTTWTICEILGGNVVAVDGNGYAMNPIEPSPHINVDRAKASSGTLVIGGSALTTEEHNKLMEIADINGGRWKIFNNQMIFYKADNTTEVMRFDLYNKAGQKAEENIIDRRRV